MFKSNFFFLFLFFHVCLNDIWWYIFHELIQQIFYKTPRIFSVSRLWIKTLTKAISLRVFSMITIGSSDGHRRKFGANTMDKLEASIFVTADTSARANSWRKEIRQRRTTQCSSGSRSTTARAASGSSPTWMAAWYRSSSAIKE